MSDREAFLRAICANPDDDAPRLVFADWLDENGDEPLAEYIRLQCQIERIPTGTNARMPLEQRQRVLERAHLDAWKAPFRHLCMGCHLRRGFVDEVQVTYRQFLENAAELFDFAPVRHWQFRPLAFFQGAIDGPVCHDVTHDPLFVRVRSFELSYYSSDELLAQVAVSPYRSGLRGVSVVQSRSETRDFARFFDSVPDLCELSATQTSLMRLAPLWRHGTRHRLKRLEIVGSKLTNELVYGLAKSPILEQLESLWLDGNPFDDRGIQALAASPYLMNLRELSMADVGIGDDGAILLAKAPLLRSVRVLNLAGCSIDARGCQALADSPYLEHLELLCLDRNRVSVGVELELTRRFGAERISISW